MGAFQAEMAIFLIGMAAFAKKRTWKLGHWALAFTSIYCLVFTFSRGAYLGFLFGLLVLGLIKQHKLLLLLAIVLVCWQSLVPNAVTERVLMTYQNGQGLDPSAEGRVSLWQDAMEVVNHDPVLGTGFNTYEYMGRVGSFRDTHNYYIKVLLETGINGFLIFLSLLAITGRMAWRLFREAKDPFLAALGCAFFGTFMCALVVNFFGDRWTYLQEDGFYWVLLGLVARGLLLVRQEEPLPVAGAIPSILPETVTQE
jgi:putative inorganic carbon (HCO3(-)) transporter